jgi:hypothetical protein
MTDEQIHQLYPHALKRAQRKSPETTSVMTDSHGNWFGVRYEKDCPLAVPTTDMFRMRTEPGK